MKIIILLTLILLQVSNSIFAQNVESISGKNIIGIGEYHYYTNNNEIKLSLIKNIVKKSNYDSIYIFLEKPPQLEYFIRLKKNKYLKEYFRYDTDRYFKKNLSLKALINYRFIKKISHLKDKRVIIKCIDALYTLRQLFFSIKHIEKKYKSIESFNKNYSGLDAILQKKKIRHSDTIILNKLKKAFFSDSIFLKKSISKFDFYYLKKIFNTPYVSNPFSSKRGNYINNKIINNYSKKKQIIFVGGAGHISNKDKLSIKSAILDNKLLNKSSIFIAIIPKKIAKSNIKSQFDTIIINKKGKSMFNYKK